MYIKSSNVDEIVQTITGLNPEPSQVVFLMIGEKNCPDLDLLIRKLNEKKISFFGGMFPAVISGNNKYEEGVVCKILPTTIKPILVKGLDSEEFVCPEYDEQVIEDRYTTIVLVDGLTSNISLFLSRLFNQLGNSVNYLGGGAGSLSLVQKPCVFTNEGVYKDAAIIAMVELKSKLGVRHGWKKIEGPFVATKSQKNIIKELNWTNAFGVYKEAVEQDSGKIITKENFFDIAKGYPFGITVEGTEYIVRDPLSVNENGELICVGEVPENTVLDILKGNKDTLINAARLAAEDGITPDIKIKDALIFDCISRVLFLENDFTKELSNIQNVINKSYKGIITEGALTLGEISSHGQGYLDFFNKTIVIGLLMNH